jgi:hypothetical protein
LTSPADVQFPEEACKAARSSSGSYAAVSSPPTRRKRSAAEGGVLWGSGSTGGLVLPLSVVFFSVVASFPLILVVVGLVFSFVLAQTKLFMDARTSMNDFAKVYGWENGYPIQDPQLDWS